MTDVKVNPPVLGTAAFRQGLGTTGTNVHTYAIRQAVPAPAMLRRAVVRFPTRWSLSFPPARNLRTLPTAPEAPQ